MTDHVKRFIEENIEFIEKEDWRVFFLSCYEFNNLSRKAGMGLVRLGFGLAQACEGSLDN